MRRQRPRARRANPNEPATLVVSRRRSGAVSLRARRKHPVERDEAALFVSSGGPYLGAHWLSITVWPWAEGAVVLEGEIDARGEVHWTAARWAAARWAADRREQPLEPALDRFGAVIDALLALYFQELPDAEYALAEFP